MLDRFKKSEIGKKIIGNETDFDNSMMEHINLFKYMVVEKDEKEYDVDKIVGKYVISHLQIFFNRSLKNRTIKNRGNRGNRKTKTLKNKT